MKVIKLSYFFTILLLVALYLFPVGGSAADTDSYGYKVFLDGNPIGTYQLKISDDNDVSTVEIEVSLDVKLLFFTVYSYQHQNSETWNNDCLSAVTSKTDDNGKLYTVDAKQKSDRLIVVRGDKRSSLRGCVRSFAYWKPELLRDGRLLNAQTGKYQKVKVNEMGQEQITIDSRPVPAWRLQLQTKKDVIDLWYSNDNRWIALQSKTRNGNTLRYEIMEDQTDV